MTFAILRHFRASRPHVDPAVKRDADELMQLWGAAAYGRATEMASQEAKAASPGHWLAVRREIGRRIGQQDDAAQKAVSAA